MSPSKIKELITKLNKQLAALAPGESLYKANINSAVYHGCDGVSSSMIKTYLACPAKYNGLYVAKTIEREEKRIFDLGSAVHGYVLELERFGDDFVVQPADIKVRRGKVWDAFKATIPDDQIVITLKEYDQVKRMSDAIFAHPSSTQLLRGGVSEGSFFKRDVETGLLIKCRPDHRFPGVCVDLKSCVSSEPEKFGRDAKNLGYHISAAMYLDITGDEKFVFVAAEKTEPHVVTAPISFDEESMELGFLKYRKALNEIASSMLFDHWPGYTDEAVVISLKPWESKELESLRETQNFEESQNVA